MPIKNYCRSVVATVTEGQSVLDAVRVMKESHVGDVIILSRENRAPIGIVTDRDIVNSITSENVHPSNVNVEDIVIRDLKVVSEEEGVYQTVKIMKDHGIRRVPVVNSLGELTGICTMDDMLGLLAGELRNLAAVPDQQIHRERMRRRENKIVAQR